MYIRRIKISSIRSVEHFEMTFPEGKEAGWHVLIGDNGTGKSTIMQAIAVGLLAYNDINAARLNWNDWLPKTAPEGGIKVEYIKDKRYSKKRSILFNEILLGEETGNKIKENEYNLKKNERNIVITKHVFKKHRNPQEESDDDDIINNGTEKVHYGPWFSAAYGPYRRFTGGNSEKEKAVSKSNPRLSAHLSIFGEDVSLSEGLNYLRDLYVKQLDKKSEGEVEYIKNFINQARLLSNNTFIDKIDSEAIFFIDGNGNRVSTLQLSDGYRSVLSLMFDLIRQLIGAYGADDVFRYIKLGESIIGVPGVVLIDEVDAHLHPTWQTRIGQWFTQYFPNIQFIVTTHSPLVCRAAESGSIWRLKSPSSQQHSGEVTGLDHDRLIYGNILDAYGTEAFGTDVERSEESNEKLQRLAHLSQLNAYGKLSEVDKTELYGLRKILITDDTTEF